MHCEDEQGKYLSALIGMEGVGSENNSQRQGPGPEAGEGTDTTTQPADEASTVRVTEERWYTLLRGIAEKARCLASWSGVSPKELCRS